MIVPKISSSFLISLKLKRDLEWRYEVYNFIFFSFLCYIIYRGDGLLDKLWFHLTWWLALASCCWWFKVGIIKSQKRVEHNDDVRVDPDDELEVKGWSKRPPLKKKKREKELHREPRGEIHPELRSHWTPVNFERPERRVLKSRKAMILVMADNPYLWS